MDAHLPARENQTLLRWWDTGLLFNLLLNASDLYRSDIRRGHAMERRKVAMLKGTGRVAVLTLSSRSISSSI